MSLQSKSTFSSDQSIANIEIRSHDPEIMCRYTSKKCFNPRVEKRPGVLHAFCELHRANANRNQRRLDSRKREAKRRIVHGAMKKSKHNKSSPSDILASLELPIFDHKFGVSKSIQSHVLYDHRLPRATDKGFPHALPNLETSPGIPGVQLPNSIFASTFMNTTSTNLSNCSMQELLRTYAASQVNSIASVQSEYLNSNTQKELEETKLLTKDRQDERIPVSTYTTV